VPRAGSGHHGGRAADGEQLLTLVEQTHPDVVLTDLATTGLDGGHRHPPAHGPDTTRLLQPLWHAVVVALKAAAQRAGQQDGWGGAAIGGCSITPVGRYRRILPRLTLPPCAVDHAGAANRSKGAPCAEAC